MSGDSDANEPAETLIEAHEPAHFAMARVLFEEYAAQLGVDLGFQGFAAELEQLAAVYAAPTGTLIVALHGALPVGCGALRRLGDGVCEMKRLYVRRAGRGTGLGRRIAERLIATADVLGYATMRLDTLSGMTTARGLYHSLGFHEIDAYYDNPLVQSIYMELALSGATPRATG